MGSNIIKKLINKTLKLLNDNSNQDVNNAIRFASRPNVILALRPDDLTKALKVSVGDYHAAVIGIDGLVYCWGKNDYGQCDVPSGLSGAIDISCGRYHTAAVKSDGTVVCWGRIDKSP